MTCNPEVTDGPAVYDVDPHPKWRALKCAVREAAERWSLSRVELLDDLDDLERVVIGEMLKDYRLRVDVREREMFGDLSKFRPLGIVSALKREAPRT